MSKTWLIPLVVGAVTAFSCGGGIIIDHNFASSMTTAGQGTMDAIAANMNYFFAHASVGGNMISGLANLRASNTARYKLISVSDDGTPPATTSEGRVYEYSRGNPAWQDKVDGFKTYMTNGWAGKVDIVLNKFCYIDPTADLTYYAISNTNGSAMAQLEAAYGSTKFVYATIPLTTDSDSDNILRNNFNGQLRTWCLANNKLLYDIADIEAWDSSGNPVTFTSGGQTYQKLWSGYAADAGHLNVDGAKQVALGFYAIGAAMDRFGGDATDDRRVSFADYLALEANFGKTSGVGWAQGDFNYDGKVKFADYLILEANFGKSVPEPGTLALLAVAMLVKPRRVKG
jgi:hypothetical protein